VFIVLELIGWDVVNGALGNGDDLAVSRVMLSRQHHPILGEEFGAIFGSEFGWRISQG